MTPEQIKEKVEETIRAIKASYGDKYQEYHFEDFRTAALKAKKLDHLIILVENLFDLDPNDAFDMVN